MKGERGTNLQRSEPSADSEDITCVECYSLCWRAKIITVEPVVFLYMLGVYFTLSFNFQYFYQRYARDKLHSANHTVRSHFCINDSYLNDTLNSKANDDVEAEATHLTFLTTLCGMLVSIVVTIIMGPMTDRFGRKFAIVSANVGAMISSLLMMIIIYFNLNLHYFIIANAISSLFGGFGVVLMGSFSYIADISSHRIRSLRIGILELMIYVGSALTSVLMGIWLSEVDCQFTSLTWAPFLCYFINIPYTLFMFPESLPKDQRLAKAGNRGCKAIWKGFLLYLRPKFVTIKLWICLGVLLVVIINMTGSTVINTYFYIRHPLEWNQKQIGYYGGYSSVTHGLALLLLMPIALAVGIPDIVLAIVGVVCSCVGYLFVGGVSKTWQMYAISSFQGTEAVVVPSLRSMMSKCVSKEEQGALFAFVASVEVLAALVGSSIYTNLFPQLHQTSYFVMSVLSAAPILPLCTVLVTERIVHRLYSKKLKDQQLTTADDDKTPLLTK